MRGLSQAASPAERRDMIVNVFPEVFTDHLQPTTEDEHAAKKPERQVAAGEENVGKNENGNETRRKKSASPNKNVEPEKLLDELLAPAGGSPALETAVGNLIEVLAEETGDDNLIEV
jgi:hypothetical protein